MPHLRRFLVSLVLSLVALALAAGLWLPTVHLFFRPALDEVTSAEGIPPRAGELAERHLALWADPELRRGELDRMRASNAEWDFMGRTFLVLALANMALRDPQVEAQALDVIDTIIDETIRLERENDIYFFLMDYARHTDFRAQPARSIFIDGEIALMIAARRLVRDRDDYHAPLAERVAFIVDSMRAGPALCAESFPNECWLFCNTAALAALRMADALDGTDHSVFFAEWVTRAREGLLDKRTGLLIAYCNYDGATLEGPEGSSIWWSAHCLQLVDPAFASEQYALARRELGRTIRGFGYAREWPDSWNGPPDIDSGPIIPGIEASAGSSGLALVAAAAFGDYDYYRDLATTLDFAAFPSRAPGAGLRYCASNQVGDAVLLYSMVQGPLWNKVLAEVRQ